MPSKQENKNWHAGHRERTRAKIRENGLSGMHDHELLEVMLYPLVPLRDTNPIAHELLDRFGSVAGVLSARESDLIKVPYIGEQATAHIGVIMELFRRFQRDVTTVKQTLTEPADYAEAFRGRFDGLRRECVYILCMTAKRELITVKKVSEGSFTTAELTTRLVLETVVATDAAVIVLAHNHTSGNLTPSQEDVVTTCHLRDAVINMGVVLADHLIFAGNDYLSMSAFGHYQPIY